jgi:DNA-binding FadR family transcriptional regulator
MTIATRKADLVADDLMRRIVRGEVPVGSLLPRENELAERYGVNRGVIREAIKLLEVHRLVRPQRRRGTEVLDPITSLSPEVLRTMLSPQPGEVHEGLLRDLLELRGWIDAEMAGLAARRRTEQDLLAFERCLAELAGAQEDPTRYGTGIFRLALVMARATHNRLFEMLMHWNGRVVADLGHVFQPVRSPSDNHLQGLHLLVELIRAQDEPAVRELVAGFHEWSTPQVLERARRPTESAEHARSSGAGC